MTLKTCLVATVAALALVGAAFLLHHHAHRRHYRLHEKIVVDRDGHACYLDASNHHLYRYHLPDGSDYTPGDYNPAAPSHITLPPGGSFVRSDEAATLAEQDAIEAQVAAAAQEGVALDATVDATADQIAAWENEGGSIEMDSDDGGNDGETGDSDAGGDDGGGGDGGDGGGD